MVKDLLENKTDKEKANIKGREIAKIKSVLRQNVKFSGADYDVEITEMNAIDGGMEVLARAWDANGQIGFGKDGTVDLERFVFINPPILVSDPLGDVIREYEDLRTGLLKQRRLREDPLLATLQSLVSTIRVKQQKFDSSRIVPGKIGNTTTTARPLASTGTAPIDAIIFRDVAAPGEVWADMRGGAGNNNANTNAEFSIWNVRATTTTDQYSRINRGGFGFTTSAIGTDTIDSATLSFFLTNKGTALGDTDAEIVDFNPAAGTITTFAISDYENGFDTTVFTTATAVSALTTAADPGSQNTFTLNASGRANINKTGDSYFGTRTGFDVDNTAPTWVSGAETFADGFLADQAGTASDPVLVVEHTAVAVSNFLLMGV